MKPVHHHTVLLLVALVCVAPASCSDTNSDKPAANIPTEPGEAPTRVILEDGIYPVVPAGDHLPQRHPENQGVELNNVPVEGSGGSSTDKIRVIPRPLLRFRNLSYFDFTFEDNECTEIAFRNTDELKAYTRDHVGSRLAVVIASQVISHHKIREAIEADQVRITCCTVGGGDHLHKHLSELKLASASAPENRDKNTTGAPMSENAPAASSPAIRLYRVIQPVNDIERAAAVYGELLGTSGKRVSPGRHYFDCGGTILACYDSRADGDGPADPPCYQDGQFIYFSVPDLDATYKAAVRLGFKIREGGIQSMPWGERMFWSTDPFGNPVSFVAAGTEFLGSMESRQDTD